MHPWSAVAGPRDRDPPRTAVPVAVTAVDDDIPTVPSGPLEVPVDPPASFMPIGGAASFSATPPRALGPFVSVQVNVDGQQNNIVGDAANEPSLAIDPTNPLRMAIGWRQFDTITNNFRQAGVAYSHDGGQTWTKSTLTPGFFRSDPVLAADNAGNFYYSSLPNLSTVEVFKSIDGGVSWGTPVYAFGGDKQWMTIDRSGGVGDGYIYQIWNVQFTCCAPNDFTRSVNAGVSFPTAYALPPPSMKWGTLDVGPSGVLYAAGSTLSQTGHLVARSSNVNNPAVAPVFDFVLGVNLGGTTSFSTGPQPAGLLGQTWVATDHSGGATHGNVYILSSVNPPGTDPLDVMFIRSTNGGLSWTSPIRVNDDTIAAGSYQWFGTMSVAPNGRIDVVWNDTQVDPDTTLRYTSSTDAGTTWAPSIAVSPSFQRQLGYPMQNKLGDYYHMISDDLGANLAYAATFNGEQDVYFLRITRDCNANGVVDICEVSCDPSSVYVDKDGLNALDCNVGSAFCNAQSECGTEQDCNGNQAPDSCDIAGGESEDCNENSVPDECELPFHWKNGSGLWNVADNWVEDSLVVNGRSVCIQDADEQATVTYTNGITSLAILACDENLTLAAGFNQFPRLTLDEPSWVRGNLMLSTNNSALFDNNRLDIDGLFTWSNGTDLGGTGTTYARGGMLVPSGIANLIAHDLVLESNTTNISNGRIGFSGASTLTIRPGAVFEHRSSSQVISGSSETMLLRNEGTFIKSVSTVATSIACRVENAGLMHVQAGTLQIFNETSDSTGAFLADPGTTLQFVGGGHEFQPTSSLVGERIQFISGRAGANNFRGTYDVSGSTLVQGTLNFVNGANVINYAPAFSITGAVNFNAVLGRTIHFDTLSGGDASFNSGDPIVVETLSLANGGLLAGISPITINDLFTFNGGATIRGPGVLNINGNMVIPATSNSRFLNNRTLNIAGTATFNGGFEVSGTSVVNNLATGLVDLRADGNPMIQESTRFNNAGRVVKAAGTGTSTIFPITTNTGVLESRIGTLQFRRLTQTAGEIFLNGGRFAMFQTTSPQPLQLQGGRLHGGGVVIGVVNHTGGIVQPGLSAGVIAIIGTYNQSGAGRLEIEIGGLTPITEHDVLQVTGTATLLGHIDVSLINGFVPSVGDTFDVVTFASRIGSPPLVNIEGLPSAIDMLVHLLTTSVQLEFAARAASADCNGDAAIDEADFAALSNCLSGPALSGDPPPIATECRCADMDLDDDVDLEDVALFQAVFGL